MPTTKRRTFDGLVDSCCHEVSFYYDIPKGFRLGEELKERLTDAAEERAKEMIGEGYWSGELCYGDARTEEELFGWWKIETD